MKTEIIRGCNRCYHKGTQDNEFTYMGDRVWSCHNCCSMWTSIIDIIETEEMCCECGQSENEHRKGCTEYYT